MSEQNDPSGTLVPATRAARVIASTTYPIVSAWEFEFLKMEEIIQERWDKSTIYIVVQRPLTYFDNVTFGEYHINFEIADGISPPLPCRINLVANGICQDGEIVQISAGWHSGKAGSAQPLRNVGALKIYREDGSFVLWWSPQKILYEMLVNNLVVEIADDGNPLTFLDFKVHYIGKSFSQKVWKRLTGHTKMQKILTVEREIGSSPDARSPFEISLIILRVVGLTDVPIVGALDENPLVGPNPIVHLVDYSDKAALDRFLHQSPVQLDDECLTREVEALLINRFRPDHNEIKFSNYPNIAGGMRSNGYSQTGLTIERLPAILYTDHQPATSLADVHPDYKFPNEPAPQIPLVEMRLGTIED